MGTNKCPKCGEYKNGKHFHKDSNRKNGLSGWCKDCRFKWSHGGPQKRNEYLRKWRQENKGKIKEYNFKNKKKIRERNLKYFRKWVQDNKEKTVKYKRDYDRNSWATNPKYKLNKIFSNGIRKSLKSGKDGRSWEKLVNYTANELKTHIEKQFKDGMTWNKFLKGEIHIDHKIPIAVFNFETPEDIDFKRCWALKNLQPLWARENCAKGDKIDKPFQPCLLLK